MRVNAPQRFADITDGLSNTSWIKEGDDESLRGTIAERHPGDGSDTVLGGWHPGGSGRATETASTAWWSCCCSGRGDQHRRRGQRIHHRKRMREVSERMRAEGLLPPKK
ncbi:MAG: DUF1559 domain-containing protein [Planctomycetes bacterium]|nr:DUF1559 domain-containing protein [Planctomycetota bacterium]